MTANTTHLGVRARWGILLALLMVALLIEPLFGSSFLVELGSRAILMVALLGAIQSSRLSGPIRVAGAITVVLWFIVSDLPLLGMELSEVRVLLSFLMVIIALVATFSILFRREETGPDTLFGATFGYLLLALACAYLFMQIERWASGSFAIPPQSDQWTSFQYFSFVTLTTVGYGDVLPLSPLARMCAAFEAVIGVFYVAVTIGSILANFRKSDRP